MQATDNKILVTTDFEQQAAIAFTYALYVARQTSAEVILLHVIEENPYLSLMIGSDAERQKIMAYAKESLQKMIENHADEIGDLIIRPLVEYGKVYEKVAEVADREFPVFIVMGKSSTPAMTQKLLGSNSSHVIKETIFPVITVKGTEPISGDSLEKRPIIVPLDLRKAIREQITAAIEFAHYFKTTIRVMTIIDSSLVSKELNVLTGLRKVKERIEKEGLVCETDIIKNQNEALRTLISDYAIEHQALMIVIMTQEESRIVKYFVGSTAQQVINQSKVPVMSVTPWEKREESVFSKFVDPLGIVI